MAIMIPKIIFHYLYIISVNEQLEVTLWSQNVYDEFIYLSVSPIQLQKWEWNNWVKISFLP